MKHLSTYILILSLSLFYSCREESISDPVTIDIDAEPQFIEHPVFEGYVQSDGEALSEAFVNIYQNEELKGQLQTDENGFFSTKDIALDSEGQVTFEGLKEDYIHDYKRRNLAASLDQTIKLNLINKSEANFQPEILENPADPELISIAGYVLDKNGDGSSATILLGYDITEVGPTTWTFDGSLLRTDEDGYYETLMPSNQKFIYGAWERDCGYRLNEMEVAAFGLTVWEEIGPFTSDVILDPKYDNVDGDVQIDLSANLLTCDGQQADLSTWTIRISDGGSLDYWITSNFSEAEFSIQDTFCAKLPIDVELYGYDETNNMFTDTLFYQITDTNANHDFGGMPACNEGIAGYSTVIANVDGVDHSYSLTKVRLEDGNLIADEINLNTALFEINNAQLGPNQTETFVLMNWFDGPSFGSVEGGVEVILDTFTENSATGTFAGEFLDAESQVVTLTGTLDLIF